MHGTLCGAALPIFLVLGAFGSARLAHANELPWGSAELVATIKIPSFRATGFAAIARDQWVLSDGDLAFAVVRVTPDGWTPLTNAPDCDELFYRRVFGETEPRLLMATANNLVSLDPDTGSFSTCSGGPNVQSLGLAADGGVCFEPRQLSGRMYAVTECGTASVVATGLPEWTDFTGCSPTYLSIGQGHWLCTYREGDSCVTSIFDGTGNLITPAIFVTNPTSESSFGNYIQPIPTPETAAGMTFGMVEGESLVGFRLTGETMLLADGIALNEGDTGRVVFDPAPEVPGSAFVMRSSVGVTRIYRLNSSGPDCDADGVSDATEIAAGAPDVNGNGVPDACECLADLFADGQVDGADLGILLNQWGLGKGAVADINRDGSVDGADLSILLNSWGACP